MNVQSAARQQLDFWHGTLQQMVGDCGETLNKNLPGATITSIASIYAHVLWGEDVIVHTMLQGKPPLYQSDGWESRTRIAFPGIPPSIDPEWARPLRMDLPQFQDYAKRVFGATDEYLAGLPDSELARKVPTPAGEQTVEWAVVTLLATHAPQHTGEIAALRGVQGLKGLPF